MNNLLGTQSDSYIEFFVVVRVFLSILVQIFIEYLQRVLCQPLGNNKNELAKKLTLHPETCSTHFLMVISIV